MSSIITDPQIVAQYAEQIAAEAAPEPASYEPPAMSGDVLLPGGSITDFGRAVDRRAEVRELNGEDEEAIVASLNKPNLFDIILSRGIISVGGKPIDDHRLDAMYAGDRDYLLLAIRRMTFGPTESFEMICPTCTKQQQIVVDLEKDVEVVRLSDDPQQRLSEVSVETKLGRINVNFPTGRTQRRLQNMSNANQAEVATALLVGCINDLDGKHVDNLSLARQLSMADRNKVIAALLSASPGPRLGEVKKACEACGNNIPVPLSLLALFRLW